MDYNLLLFFLSATNFSIRPLESILSTAIVYFVKLYEKVGQSDSCYVNFESSTTRSAIYLAPLELVSF